MALFLATLPAKAAVNVTQHHNNPSRDGLYLDPAFTLANAATLALDPNFNATITGNVYAQPLYVEGGPNGPLVIAVTESNNVYGLNATTGAIVWQRNLGAPVTSGLPCGNINPLGITGTPVVDLATRALFFNAEVSGIGHQIFSLNVDTGATNAGWPVTVSSAISGFDSDRSQSQRGAVGLAGTTLYVPYGGRFGDCGTYRGRLIGVNINNPASVTGWATTIGRAGLWAPGGVASDGTNLYVATGNGSTTATWGGSEAVIRLQPGPFFSGAAADYWAPTNWAALDAGDTDLGGSGPILVDVPGATPSALVVAIGKDRNAYLLNRNNLGGVSTPLAQAVVSTGTVIGAAASYRTNSGTFVVLRPVSGTLTAFRINAANPPTISTGWSVSSSGRTAPFVTSTPGYNNVIVWAAGTDGRIRGYNGETGAVVFNGGGAGDVMTGTVRSFNTGIAARGRIYYAVDGRVYSFKMANVPPSVQSAVSRKTHGAVGDFDIPLPLTGTPGVECRSGGATGDHTLVVNFGAPTTVTGDTQAQSSVGNIGAGGVSNGGVVTVSGNSVIVPLTNMPNAQTTNVTLSGVTDGVGYGNLVVPLSALLGDVNGNGSVSGTDISATKAAVGEGTVTSSNFRSDVIANGSLNASDVAAVKSNSGTGLP